MSNSHLPIEQQVRRAEARVERTQRLADRSAEIGRKARAKLEGNHLIDQLAHLFGVKL